MAVPSNLIIKITLYMSMTRTVKLASYSKQLYSIINSYAYFSIRFHNTFCLHPFLIYKLEDQEGNLYDVIEELQETIEELEENIAEKSRDISKLEEKIYYAKMDSCLWDDRYDCL